MAASMGAPDRALRTEAAPGPGDRAMGGPAMAALARRNSAVGAITVPDTDRKPSQVWLRPEKIATDFSENRQRYRVSVQEYVTFHEQGFLVVRGLISPEEVEELRQHTEDLIYGRIEVLGLEPPPPGASVAEIERRYLRIHMLHRQLEIHERYLLHPRILDVLEALIGPDVMAMQTMLFIKPPGGAGQGYHQDSYYIPTYPDTLCGAWLAIDRADEENGCLWFTVGSQHEPIYPTEDRLTQNHSNLRDLMVVENVSHMDEKLNTLSRIAAKYPGKEVPVICEPGDVVFFGGHILHRSHPNRSKNRFRRAFVGHYANARSFTMWGSPNRREPANHLHILARGWTHLPFALPRFGTPCAANQPRPAMTGDGGEPMPMAMMASGDDMVAAPQDPERNDPAAMLEHDAQG
jgi:phytanoyl-CoA hydroxylase